MEIEVIYGPPGTGKTTELMNILCERLKVLSTKKVAFVTFTREGANQGITRAISLFNKKRDDFPYFKTLHSLAFTSLEMSKDKMMSSQHYRDFSKAIGMHFLGYYTEDLIHNDDQYLFLIDLERNNPETFKKYSGNYDPNIYSYVKEQYFKFKKLFKIYDYTDLIETFIALDTSVDVDEVFLDEAQDLTSLQWDMFWCAFKNCKKVHIAGDDDQAIFDWSGADVKKLLQVKGSIRILEHSHRLPNNILEYSKKISSKISLRIEKDYYGKKDNGILKELSDFRQLPKIGKNESWLLLSRNNSFLKVFEEYLISQGLFFYYKDTPSISREFLKVLNGLQKFFMKVEPNTVTEDEKLFIESFCGKNWELKSLNKCIEHSSHNQNYFIKIMQNYDLDKDSLSDNIKLSTIHKVKGAEADNVIVLLDLSKNAYLNLLNNPDAEHRNFYVAMTRAKENLYVIKSQSRYAYNV